MVGLSLCGESLWGCPGRQGEVGEGENSSSQESSRSVALSASKTLQLGVWLIGAGKEGGDSVNACVLSRGTGSGI